MAANVLVAGWFWQTIKRCCGALSRKFSRAASAAMRRGSSDKCWDNWGKSCEVPTFYRLLTRGLRNVLANAKNATVAASILTTESQECRKQHKRCNAKRVLRHFIRLLAKLCIARGKMFY